MGALRIEYLELFQSRNKGETFSAQARMFENRRRLCRRFAWAVPTEEAVREIAKLGPLVELGAGSGYWASLIAQTGAKIEAFDANIDRNPYGFIQPYFDVRPGDEEILADFGPETNLFLCWPCYETNFAANALERFRGQWFAYIGEGAGGCTGDENFHEALAKNWAETKSVPIPQWPGIHDRLTIYRRAQAI